MLERKTSFLPVAVFLLLLLLLCPFLVIAHGTGGTYEETVNGYSIDNGFTPEEPTVGEITRFDFSVASETEAANDIYTDVWVRITKEKELIFSGDIHNPNIGPTGFTHVFLEPGEYEIFSRFQNDSETIVEATYFINVLPDGSSSGSGGGSQSFLWLSLAAALGLVVGFVFGRKLTTSDTTTVTDNSA